MRNTRKITVQLMELADQDILDWQTIAEACLQYMSESEIADMATINGLLPEKDDDEEEE
jgi:hypothetical protein